MEDNPKKSYYAIIPANVRYDKRLTPKQIQTNGNGLYDFHKHILNRLNNLYIDLSKCMSEIQAWMNLRDYYLDIMPNLFDLNYFAEEAPGPLA